MGWESCGVDGFDLGLLLQGQAQIKSAYNSLIWQEILCMSCFNHVPSGDTLRRDAISSWSQRLECQIMITLSVRGYLNCSLAFGCCLFGRYNLYRFSDAQGLVI